MMAAQPADLGIDLEAQPVFRELSEVGGSATQRSPSCQPPTERVTTVPASTSQEVDCVAQPAASQEEGRGRSEIHEMSAERPESASEDATRQTPTEVGQGQIQAVEQTGNSVATEPYVNLHILHGWPDREPKEKPQRMIGDFDGSANALWTLYGKEAKSHDEARIQTLKEDMDGVLIFAGLFSAALTPFIIDNKQNLKVNPADQMVYYLQQNTAILSQISQQISSIAPQVSLPSTPPPPFPAFSPSASDIRVNVFWFMALVFSLSTALLAILVQQWVRDYMHVFQKYSDPLKSARLRQYLHEGCEGWYMPVVAEAVPGLLHVSLFLFFVGLCDAGLNINTIVGISTTIPVGLIGLLYIFTTFAPIIFPDSPYQNSFSVLIWYLTQKLRGRRFKDRSSGGTMKPLSSNMAQGQMQLAMEETEERKGRDERAIRWLFNNQTEDDEMDSFLATIPGSFDGEWGEEVWRKVFEASISMPLVRPSRAENVWDVFSSTVRVLGISRTRDSHSPTNATTLQVLAAPRPSLNVHLRPGPDPIQEEDVVHKLSRPIAHILAIWRHRGLSASDEVWRRRTRACVETTTSVVCLANANLDEFADIVKLLGDIGSVEETRQSSLVGMDQSFVKRWTCLSLMAIRWTLRPDNEQTPYLAMVAARVLEGEDITVTSHGQALTGVQKISVTFDKAWGCLRELRSALCLEDATDDQVKQTLRDYESHISELEHINIEADDLKQFDEAIYNFQSHFGTISQGITSQLPGVRLDDFYTEPIHFTQFVSWSQDHGQYQFILPGQKLKGLCSLAIMLRNILQGQWGPEAYKEIIKNLQKTRSAGLLSGRGNLWERQLWRLQDLQCGGLGFTVELFFLALRQLLSTSSSKKSRSALYISTFRNITSQRIWDDRPLATQNLLLSMVASDDSIFSSFDFPDYIKDEFLVLLQKVFKGQTGPHIDDAVLWLARQLPPHWRVRSYRRREATFLAKTFVVLTRARAQSS